MIYISVCFYFSNQNKIDLQIEITRFINTQLKRLNTNGSNIFINCPTLFDGKEGIIKLIIGLVTVSDGLTNAFSFINRIIKVILVLLSILVDYLRLNI